MQRFLPEWVHPKAFVETRTVGKECGQRSLKVQSECQMMIPANNSIAILLHTTSEFLAWCLFLTLNIRLLHPFDRKIYGY